MTSLLNRLFGRSKRGSGATAKNRLHFVLQHDRINLPPERAEEMKKEILAVIVKYLAVDQERVEIDLEQRDRMHSKLVAELPIVKETDTAENLKREPGAADAGANGVGKVDENKPADPSEEDDKEPSADKSKDHKTEADDKR